MNAKKIRDMVKHILQKEKSSKTIDNEKAKESKHLKSGIIKKGERFYFASKDIAMAMINEDSASAMYINASSLVAPTEEEAMELYKACEMRTEYEQWCMEYPVNWKDPIQYKYFAYYSYVDGNIHISSTCQQQIQGTIYCANEGHIRAFIDNKGWDFWKYIIGIGLPKYFLEV